MEPAGSSSSLSPRLLYMMAAAVSALRRPCCVWMHTVRVCVPWKEETRAATEKEAAFLCLKFRSTPSRPCTALPGTADICRNLREKRSKLQKVTAELSLKIFFKIYKKYTASPKETMQHFVIFLREKWHNFFAFVGRLQMHEKLWCFEKRNWRPQKAFVEMAQKNSFNLVNLFSCTGGSARV